jgi:hypothetical protein
VKWSEGLSNRFSTIIRRYTDHMRLTAYMAVFFYHILSYSFGSIFIIVFMVVCFVCFCLILQIMYFYYVNVFLLLCMFCSRHCVSFCCSVYCLCVNVYRTAATGCQPNCS